MRFCCTLIASLLIFVSISASAETSLYEITKGDEKIYLGGTIHVLRNSDYPLPPGFEHAYENAKILVLETDMKQASSPEFGRQMAQAFMYTEGKNLAQDLHPKLWQELQTFADQRQFPLGQMSMFKAMFVSLALSMAEMQSKGFGVGQGVDAYFYQKAILGGKATQELETTGEVLAQLTSLADMDANLVIKSTLRDIHKMDQVLAKSLEYWRVGELDKLDKEMAADMRKETPQIYQQLLVARNQAWLPKIEAMFTTPAVELVLVGSLHLSSKNGLLAQLKQRGYQIKPYKITE
ncbi:TraB/GumN family protein [Cellvibrio sp. OA-2007]|uniref:TraB/GumN family protein n=1 Tax=Cellvibrio sp. OA-2007 TaxID=529823 RepID=UPI0007860911|nr:TraB/GumN family protein [Cellvibrio sp. OA-2007]